MKRSLLLCIALFPLSLALAGGKHLEIMAPLSRQEDFQGKPQLVVERCYEEEPGTAPKLLSTSRSEFDAAGNKLRDEEVDEEEKTKETETYQYDAEGTWTGLVEQSGNSLPITYRIFLDPATRRIAQVDAKSKETEFYIYSEQGFEMGTIKKTASGQVIEQTTMKRNAANKEEHILFEEKGKKAFEISIRWSDKGFQMQEEMIFHADGGDRMVANYEYSEFDAAGNWIVQIKKQVMHQANGERMSLPDEITKREIKYHP